MKTLPYLAALLFFTFSCFRPDNLTLEKVDNINVGNFDNNGVKIDMEVYIKNHSYFRYRVDEMNAYLIFENDTAALAFLCEPLVIPANSTNKYKICASVPYSKVITGGIAVFRAFIKEGVQIDLKGQMKFHVLFINLTGPIDFKTNLKMNS